VDPGNGWYVHHVARAERLLKPECHPGDVEGPPAGQAGGTGGAKNGYNGGKDQFGRTVANPAGIDLADGVFWDARKLVENSWVDLLGRRDVPVDR
jgi:hypothetical protein